MELPSRHVFCEHLDFEALARPEVLGALVERGVHPIVAVTPSVQAGVPRLAASLREVGLRVALWPMLDSRDGRWASLHTWPRYTAHVEELLEELERADVRPDELLVDLEPPIARLRSILAGQLRRARVSVPHATPREVGAWLSGLRAGGIRLRASVVPVTVASSDRVARGWQRLLGTPVHDGIYDHVSVMAYSTLFEGYSRGLLGRADAVALVAAASLDAVRRFGTRAGVALGCVGVGALGDERAYRSAAELAEDVAVARAAGIDDIVLFALEGALARGPVEPWLDALVQPHLAKPRPTVRSRGVHALTTAIGLGAGLFPWLDAPRER